MITKNQIDYFFNVDLINGKFYWKNVSKHHLEKNGKEAGHEQKNKSGKSYWVIKVNKITYKRGRLLFFYINGYFPTPCVDHINGNSLDDRPENLRQASILENSWNHKGRKKKSKLPMGVRLCNKKYMARISYKKETIYIGVFESPELAYQAYKLKRMELYGKFSGF